MLNLKDWLAITFFPIEDEKKLEELRKLKSPFMMNISKCFETGKIEEDEMKKICEEIVKTASSYVDPRLQAKLKHVIFQDGSNETLKNQHEALAKFNMK